MSDPQSRSLSLTTHRSKGIAARNNSGTRSSDTGKRFTTSIASSIARTAPTGDREKETENFCKGFWGILSLDRTVVPA